MLNEKKIKAIQLIVSSYFKNSKKEPYQMSPGECGIFETIVNPKYHFVWINAPTRYGKSETLAIAIIFLASFHRLKIPIVAGSEKKANKIMEYVVAHLGDHPRLYDGLINLNILDVERLKIKMSKEILCWSHGGWIYITSVQARDSINEGESVVGEGGDVVVLEEAGLINSETQFSKIVRMPEGEWAKLVMIGNCFENSVFERAYNNRDYKKVQISLEQAFKEGRLDRDRIINYVKPQMTPQDWLRFYEGKFPQGGVEDGLILKQWINLAINQKGCEGEYKQSGLDVSRFGSDKTIYAHRKGGVLFPLEQTEKMDTMGVVGWTLEKLQRDKPERHCTDSVGIGSGVHDRLEEIQGGGFKDEEKDWSETELLPVNVGESPTTKDAKEEFFNLRAQLFWHLRMQFVPDQKTGHSNISIPNDPELIKQLAELRYKYSSERKKKVEAKDEMKKRLGMSPDKLDAAALAFWNPEEVGVEPQLFVASME